MEFSFLGPLFLGWDERDERYWDLDHPPKKEGKISGVYGILLHSFGVSRWI